LQNTYNVANLLLIGRSLRLKAFSFSGAKTLDPTEGSAPVPSYSLVFYTRHGELAFAS